MTHAYLEDFLRTIAAELLPVGDENCLREIPLAGSGGFGRGEKFTLGQLVPHKGKSVDGLLHESVSDYLSRSNYNSTAEIAALISRLGFNVEEHNKNFDVIDKMIKWRHQIVHRADRVNESGKPVLQPINRSEVLAWLDATHGFTSGLVSPLITKIAVLLVPDLMQSRQHARGAATPLLAPLGRNTSERQ